MRMPQQNISQRLKLGLAYQCAGIARSLWLGTPPEGAPDMAAQPVSPTLGTAIVLSTAGVLVLGVLPNLLVQYAPVSTLVAGP